MPMFGSYRKLSYSTWRMQIPCRVSALSLVLHHHYTAVGSSHYDGRPEFHAFFHHLCCYSCFHLQGWHLGHYEHAAHAFCFVLWLQYCVIHMPSKNNPSTQAHFVWANRFTSSLPQPCGLQSLATSLTSKKEDVNLHRSCNLESVDPISVKLNVKSAYTRKGRGLGELIRDSHPIPFIA